MYFWGGGGAEACPHPALPEFFYNTSALEIESGEFLLTTPNFVLLV